jgi:hypothetical protein
MRSYCHSCRPFRAIRKAKDARIEELIGDADTSPTQRAVLEALLDLAQVAGWTVYPLRHLARGLHRVLATQPDGQPLKLSQLRAELGPGRVHIAAKALRNCGLLVDDSVPGIRVWVDQRADTLPEGFREEVRAWLLALLEGEERARPRAPQTLYPYFGRVQPHLLAWSRTYADLREVTEADVKHVLDSLTGHQRAGTFTSLRSLFRFAKRHRLIFTDPTRRLSVGQAPRRTLLPMTDEEIAIVKAAAITPAQRLVIALVAVYAARAKAIRELTLDDIDLANRRITLGGTLHKLSEFAYRSVVQWLEYRHRRWPHTPEPARACDAGFRGGHRADQRVLPDLALPASRCPAGTHPW